MLLFRSFFVFFILCISGCGFKPLYGKNSHLNPDGELAKIKIIAENNEISHRLKDVISEIVSANINEDKYILNISATSDKQTSAIYKTSESSRYIIKIKVEYSLHDQQSKKLLDKDVLMIFSNYEDADSEYLTYNAETYSLTNALKEIGHNLTARISMILSQGKNNEIAS